jgi:hypothetical protein
VAWLYCLSTLGVFGEQDRVALVSHVFLTYLTLMRKLQTTYWLEPAGACCTCLLAFLPRSVRTLTLTQPLVGGFPPLMRGPSTAAQARTGCGV